MMVHYLRQSKHEISWACHIPEMNEPTFTALSAWYIVSMLLALNNEIPSHSKYWYIILIDLHACVPQWA